MFALANVVHFLADEFARLGGGRLPFARILPRSLNCFLFWHTSMLRIRLRTRMGYHRISGYPKMFKTDGGSAAPSGDASARQIEQAKEGRLESAFGGSKPPLLANS